MDLSEKGIWTWDLGLLRIRLQVLARRRLGQSPTLKRVQSFFSHARLSCVTWDPRFLDQFVRFSFARHLTARPASYFFFVFGQNIVPFFFFFFFSSHEKILDDIMTV
jgi:hypothetical protein